MYSRFSPSADTVAMALAVEVVCLGMIGWRLWQDWKGGGWAADKLAKDRRGWVKRRFARLGIYWFGLAVSIFYLIGPALDGGQWYAIFPKLGGFLLFLLSLVLIIAEGIWQNKLRLMGVFKGGQRRISWATVMLFVLIVLIVAGAMSFIIGRTLLA